MTGSKPTDQRERFFRLVTYTADGCWVWTGYLHRTGYGRFNERQPDGSRVQRQAHRFGFELLRGPIPPGMTLDHLCRNRACVNPDHLDPCTIAENARRSPNYNGTKTHCRNGHPLSGDNLVIRSDGWRRCRTCDRAKYTRRKARAAEAVA